MYTFKDVHIIGVWFSHTRAKELNEKLKRRKENNGNKGRRRRTKSPALGVESSESDGIPWVRL